MAVSVPAEAGFLAFEVPAAAFVVAEALARTGFFTVGRTVSLRGGEAAAGLRGDCLRGGEAGGEGGRCL
jgi:hypothetical protein